MDIFTRRVCVTLDGMDAVTVRRDIAYSSKDADLRFDLYSPPGQTGDDRSAAVIIVSGYPGMTEPRRTPLSYKDIGWTVSMSQLIAVSGMAAISYTNRDPAADLRQLFDHVHDNAQSLNIDAARIGVMAVSGNVPTALTTIMRDAPHRPACAVFGYGCLLDLEGATDVADTAKQFGFVDPNAGRTIADLRRDVPLFITRAGRDQFAAMNASIDRFIVQGLLHNLPIAFVNHPEGPHAFDLFDPGRTSRDIVRQTLRFLRQHLTVEVAAGQAGGD